MFVDGPSVRQLGCSITLSSAPSAPLVELSSAGGE
jgi:hypothetical protein